MRGKGEGRGGIVRSMIGKEERKGGIDRRTTGGEEKGSLRRDKTGAEEESEATPTGRRHYERQLGGGVRQEEVPVNSPGLWPNRRVRPWYSVSCPQLSAT